ncbi:MAG TPA: hypothetical protein VGS22_20415 [Thermoanaerobaculia bacterium]|jgi:hypothetical protein|nr:hypothetical protein [Thermoanaerobaculia bacterium]
MKRATASLFLVLALSLLGAQPAISTETTEDKVYGEIKSDKALVYLIRKGRFQGGGRTMFLYSDKRFLGAVDSDTYTFAYLDPGTHLFWTNWTKVRREIDLVPGREYYIEVWTEFNLLGSDEGKALLEKIESYATPEPKELKTAEKQILERYSKALSREEESGNAKVERVAATQEPADPTGHLKVPSYTEIPLELMENVSSYLTTTGSSVSLRVASDVTIDGQRVIAANTPVIATMRHAEVGIEGGVGGNFDIVVPAINAPDGSRIPMLGRLDATGKRRTGAALAAGIGTTVVTTLATGGVAAIFLAFPRGKEAFFLVGEEFKVWTADNHWINLAATTATPADEAKTVAPELRFEAKTEEEISFSPQKRRSPSDLKVILQTHEAVRSVAAYVISDWTLPKPVRATKFIRKDDAWLLTFEGWNIVRYARFSAEETIIPVELRGTLADGRPFIADVQVKLVLKGAG